MSWAIVGLTIALAQAGEPRLPPEGFVDLAVVAPTISLEIRYATANNFTGAVLPGYAAPGAWLRTEPAHALAAAQQSLASRGLGLRVYDAYRPLRATLAMVDWATRTGQTHLLDQGYIARRSNHNRGTTVDLTLITLATGEPLDMGTPWDTLNERAHTANATGAVAEHRRWLVEVLRANGFVNYHKEWWHFTWHPDDRPPPRDVPYGAEEPNETPALAPPPAP